MCQAGFITIFPRIKLFPVLNQINTVMKKTASLLFFILILKNSLLGNLILSEIEAGNLIIEENSAAGTIIGKITPVNLDSNKIKFSLKPTFPRGLSPKLWLDASDLDWAGTQWIDKSQNSNHATMHGSAHGYPSIKQNAHNGMSLMHYCGAIGAYHSFDELNDIRTIFWVLRKESGYSFMLSHDKLVHFHFNTGQFWWEKHASPHVLNGRLSINGNSIDGSNTDIPKDLSIISLRTTGDVTANNFSNDRNIEARFFNGDLGELIIFNETLSDYQIKEVESYLHRKWNLPLAYEPILPAFAISTDGVISSNRTFDHETSASVSVTLIATDSRGVASSATFSVSIRDLPNDLDEDGVLDSADPDRDGDGLSNALELANFSDPDSHASSNYAPVDLNSTAELTILENRPAGTYVGQFTASDVDNNSTLSFSLSPGTGDADNDHFTLDSSGLLRTVSLFDFEKNASVFSLRVRVTDERNASSERSFSVSLIDEDVFSPLTIDSNLMLWLDAADPSTLDRGTHLGELGPPEDGDSTLFWVDKSGKGHNALKIKGYPTYAEKTLNGMPSIDTSEDTYEISNSAVAFDAWERMTIVIVYKWSKVTFWAKGIWKHGEGNGNNSVSGWSFDIMNPNNNQAAALWWARKGSSANRLSGNLNMDARSETKLITIRYDGTENTLLYYSDGSFQQQSTSIISRFISNQIEPLRVGGPYKWGEILIFNDTLDDSDRQRVEGYLAHKWNLVQELDEYHTYKNGGIMDGTISLAEELPVGTAFVNLSDVDPDYNASWSYSLTEANASNDNAEFTFSDQASFDPSATEGLSLWLDASDVSTITADQDGNVSRWADKSSNEYNATAVSGQFPVSGSQKLNGRNVLAWSSNKKMTSNAPNDANWQDCYLVARWSGGSTFPSYNSLFTGKNEPSFHGQIHSNRFSWGGWVDEIYLNTKLTKASDSVIEEISQPFIISFSSKGEISANGYVLGADRNINQRSWVGEIAEVLSFDRSLNSLEKQSIEAYLSNKWGLVHQLPPSHPGRKDVLLAATSLDYETNASTYNIHVRASANGSVQNEKEYKILLSNVFEDLDNDGIEDHYDLDDDGDGFPDLIEIAYPSDPRDPSSHANVAPNELNASGVLTISEDAPLNTIVGTFSASDPDGDSNFSYALPKTIKQLGPVLWLDANHPSAKSPTWEDLSTYNRDANRYNSPTVVENIQNGLSVMRYQASSSTTDYHEWASVNNIRSAFAVLKRNSGHVLSHASAHHFHSNGSKILHSTHAHANLKNGISRLNGLEIDARFSNSPSSDFFLISFAPIGNVSTNRIGKDRNLNSSYNNFDGDYGELVLFDQPLDDWEVESVEYYLARKWGLQNNLAQTHSYKDKNNTLGNEHFTIDNNGTLTLAQTIDYETEQNFSLTVRATDPHGASFDKLFTIEVTDTAEDVDGDGTPDHLDNDIDNDGLSNADELLGKSDPYNSNSTNRPPNAITLSNLSFTENLATGTKIGEINAIDPDGNENLSFSLHPLLEVTPSLWLDGSDIDGNLKPDTYGVGDDISLWVDKSGNGYDFNETKGKPTYSAKEGKGVVKFDGQTLIWTGTSLYPDFNNYTIFSVARYSGGLNKRLISDVSQINWLFGYHSSGVDSFYVNGWLSNNRNVPADQDWHLHIGTMNSSDYGQGWVDQINMVDSPNGAGAVYRPKLLALGGWGNAKTSWFTEMSKGEVAELIVFDQVLNTAEIKQVEDYLIGKWNLPLPTGNSSVDFFEIDENGTLFTKRAFNYETDDHNYSLTVRAVDNYGAYSEQNFTLQLTNELEDADGNGIEDYESNQSTIPHDIVTTNSPLRVSENAAIGSVVGQVKAVDLDGDAHHKYTLSTSGDPNRFHSSSVDGLTAWFDASDSRTIQKVEATNKLSAWRNKIDPDIYLSPVLGKEPDTNGSINGLNAIEFTAADQISKRLWGYKNGANWNPMGVNGAASGKLTDGSLYMTFRSNKSTKSGFPFNFGWGDHFPWNNNQIFWRFSDVRRATNFSSNGEELMLCFEFSVSKGIQKLYKNGTVIMSGPRTTETNIGGAFFFPSDYGSQNIPEWTVGEMLVVRGVMQQEEHLRIEGYLAHKWGLESSLPNDHLYSKNYQSFDQSDVFLSIDNNGTLRTTTTFDHEIDANLTISIRAMDDDGLSFDKNFTIDITNLAEADLDGDGVEDLLDEDWDGDGVSNWNEWQNNSDPMDQNSKNRSPIDIIASNLYFKENVSSGTNILNFSTDDPDENQTHSYKLVSDGKIGWRTAHLTGDQDAGIDSSRSYTCAVNVNGADQVINGITFKGEAGLSGTGWEITSGFQSKHASQQSTVNGQVGKVLSNGMRFGGNPQKIKLTGLTIGKKYVFTLYSQAWGTETAREALITNSDSLRHITVNQNSYTSSTNDGILVECTYIASSTTTEFTISPMTSSTWHLYAFSNYETSSLFTLNKNGHLRLEKTFDYETDEHSFPLTVKVTDDHNISLIKEFTLSLNNEIEDLDGDLLENHEDPDIDGDGVSNANEMLYGTDPWDKTSDNEPPSGWQVLEKLQVQENQPVGSLVGKIQGLDPQGSNTLNYSLIPQYPKQIKPLLWLDATDSSTFEHDEEGAVKIWKNKIGSRHDFVQGIADNRPSLQHSNLNNYNSLYFDGNDFMHSLGSINLGDNFSILMVAQLEEVDSAGDALFSYNSNCEGGYFNFRSHQQDGFHGHYFSNETTGNNKVFFAQSQAGPALYELVFDLKQNFVQCFLNGTDKGKVPYTSAPGTHHIFRLFANLDISQHPKGSIGETLIFNSALPVPQRKEIESYLGNKWNLPIHNIIPHHLFQIQNDGTIFTTKQFDFEKHESLNVKIRASDDYNMSIEKEFLISIENIIEDRDGDGIEDAYDFDFDNDGIVDEIDLDDDNDGITDLNEIIWGTDPFNQFSHAQVPIVRTLGHEGNTTSGYALLGEIITNGGAPISDLGILLSYDINFNNTEPIAAIERDGQKFKLLIKNFRYGSILYYEAYGKNGVGLSNGGIKKIIIPQKNSHKTLWTEAKNLIGGWKDSSWFGEFKEFKNISWIYHSQFKWLYISELEDKSIWLWNEKDGWRWTQEDVFPYLFRWHDTAWIYLLKNPGDQILYYNANTHSIEPN